MFNRCGLERIAIHVVVVVIVEKVHCANDVAPVVVVVATIGTSAGRTLGGELHGW